MTFSSPELAHPRIGRKETVWRARRDRAPSGFEEWLTTGGAYRADCTRAAHCSIEGHFKTQRWKLSEAGVTGSWVAADQNRKREAKAYRLKREKSVRP